MSIAQARARTILIRRLPKFVPFLAILTLLSAALLAPAKVLACACGCAVFDVGTSSLLPSGPGGVAFLEYDFLDQTKNWSGNSSAPAAANDDKEIRSNFLLAGAQYMFNDDWGAMLEVPYTDRMLRTTDPSSGDIVSFDHGSLGDVRLMGVYSGFSPDMSVGIIAGLKLPTGDHTYANFDPDTEIGSGSTDLLLGAYKTGELTDDESFSYFAQALWQHEISIQDSYRPGAELNGAVGVSYNNITFGDVHVGPVFQMIVSNRGRDGSANGDPDNTGYTRVILSPGVEADYGDWKIYTDVEVPVFQHMNGNQLVAPVAVKLILSHSFAGVI
jgi:hypothetical protein